MRSLKYPPLWLQDFTRFGSKTSYHLVNTGPGWYIGNGDDHLLQMGITWAEVIEIYVYSDKHMDQTTVVSKVIITCHYSSSKWHIDIVGTWQYLSKHLKQNLIKSHLPKTYCSVVKWFWNFAESMVSSHHAMNKISKWFENWNGSSGQM